MKLLVVICLFVLSISIFNPCFSQKQVEISGVKYILHTVIKSETVFNICQKYKVSQKDIMQANPGLPGILKAGSTVKIPVATVSQETEKPEPAGEAQPATEEEFYYHKVAPKQTLFSIAKQYGITANDLIRNNPELTNGIVPGQVLKIPVSITNVDAQKANDIASTQIDVSEYSVHPVVSGETLYSLEQRYGISHDEMMKFNPALQNGLKAGMKLKIPAKKAVASVEPVTVPGNVVLSKYKVEKGETLFSLAARFGVDVAEIKKVNPSLFSRSLETGEIISIPQQSSAKNQDSGKTEPSQIATVTEPNSEPPQDCDPINSKKQKYKAALLLPLYLAGNENPEPTSIDKALLLSKISITKSVVANPMDTAVVLNGANIDQRALGFLEFYEGALLALDSVQRRGMNVELYVFDSSNQKMINALLQLDEFRDLNLIIGPVYPEIQETVASFAAKNRIPMVSPLASAGNLEQNNSWYFKVNPSREYQIEQTASYAAENLRNKNFILLQLSGNSSSADAQLARLCKEKLAITSKKNLFHEYNIQQQGINSLKPLLADSAENIFIIPTDNEAQVSVAVTNLTALAEHYNIVLLGTQALPKLKSIQTENYHRIRLRYLSPYLIDYNRHLVRRFVGQYRQMYSAEPTQFSFQGFDVTYYFLSALYRYGKDFRNCLSDYPMELTQMDFNFEKVAPMGGYTNHNLFVTGYERNFDVLNLGTFGGHSLNQKK
ncbi:LysM-repeat proteins and domains [Aquipluma nitroreducens]|uniref:LysM-repeat proteins and domains n=1 Tax=Aquipluma nitroreducens TaxID=2010828 RepID=A0A5K7SFD0_9BACT|nr:LysM peptidoglycan-binding domain-containing protein [Aquipluma nitroreducens]BBE19944.1 LysM-repeat proteins and domains [Aquipluma nitroreducens]